MCVNSKIFKHITNFNKLTWRTNMSPIIIQIKTTKKINKLLEEWKVVSFGNRCTVLLLGTSYADRCQQLKSGLHENDYLRVWCLCSLLLILKGLHWNELHVFGELTFLPIFCYEFLRLSFTFFLCLFLFMYLFFTYLPNEGIWIWLPQAISTQVEVN